MRIFLRNRTKKQRKQKQTKQKTKQNKTKIKTDHSYWNLELLVGSLHCEY